MSLATQICAFLLLLHTSAATATEDGPENTRAIGSPLNADISEMVLLSFEEPWQDAHSTFARRIARPLTTWSVENDAFEEYFFTVFSKGKQPVFFTVDNSEILSTRKIRGVRWFTCWVMFLAWNISDFHSLAHNTSWTPPRSVCQAGYLKMDVTSTESLTWRQESSTHPKSGSKDTLGLLRNSERSRVQGLRELTVLCVKRMHNKGIENSCEDTAVMAVFTLLNRNNITVKRVEAFNTSEIHKKLQNYRTDIVLFYLPLQIGSPTFFDLPVIRVVQGTFYSRVGTHRVVSLLEVARESWKLVAATIALLIAVVFVFVVIGGQEWSISRDIFDTAFFLLAAVLATSASQRNLGGHSAIVRKALLGLWLTALLPLSVYFRTELTAVVTLRRPAYRIDTLKKLEDALDRHDVAPCVVEDTLSYMELYSYDPYLPQQSLWQKLRLASARLGEDELVTSNLSDCIQCASRPDRVCYVGHWHHPSTSLLKPRNVAAFVEHLKIELIGFVMPKFEWSYRPLRRLFLAIDEHKLIDWDSREPEYDNPDTEFDISSLLTLLVILHATSCLVLVLEVVVARSCRRKSVRCFDGQHVQRTTA